MDKILGSHLMNIFYMGYSSSEDSLSSNSSVSSSTKRQSAIESSNEGEDTMTVPSAASTTSSENTTKTPKHNVRSNVTVNESVSDLYSSPLFRPETEVVSSQLQDLVYDDDDSSDRHYNQKQYEVKLEQEQILTQIQKHRESTQTSIQPLSILKQSPSSLIISYSKFVRKYRFILNMVESMIDKIIVYRIMPSNGIDSTYHHKRSEVRGEVAYAMLNLVTFFNDVLYYYTPHTTGNSSLVGGCSKNGMTFPSTLQEQQNSSKILWACRIMLSILDCTQPAIEQIYHQSNLISKLNSRKYYSRSQNRSGLVETIIGDLQHQPWDVIVKIEWCKAFCRLVVLLIHHYNQFQESSSYKDQLPKGILCSGGEIIPGEDLHTSNSAHFGYKSHEEQIIDNFRTKEQNLKQITQKLNEQAKRNKQKLSGYVGKRTGWSSGKESVSVNKACKEKVENPFSMNQLLKKNSSTIDALLKICFMQIAQNKQQVLTLIGDVLHIIRPLIYARSQHHILQDYMRVRLPNQPKHGNSLLVKMMRTWILSFMVDIFSQKLILMGSNNFLTEATEEELQRRKMRWFLYSLRSPIWSMFTKPMVNKLANILQLGGLGPYLRNIIEYWQQHHFMLD